MWACIQLYIWACIVYMASLWICFFLELTRDNKRHYLVSFLNKIHSNTCKKATSKHFGVWFSRFGADEVGTDGRFPHPWHVMLLLVHLWKVQQIGHTTKRSFRCTECHYMQHLTLVVLTINFLLALLEGLSYFAAGCADSGVVLCSLHCREQHPLCTLFNVHLLWAPALTCAHGLWCSLYTTKHTAL